MPARAMRAGAPRNVVADDAPARGEEIFGERAAHDAETDNTDGALLFRCHDDFPVGLNADHFPFMFIATEENARASRLATMSLVAAAYFLKCSVVAMRLRGRRIVVDFVDQHVVRILLRDRDVELAAARLLHRGRAVLLERRKIGVDLARHHIDIDRIDLKRARLRGRLMAAHRHERPTPRRRARRHRSP